MANKAFFKQINTKDQDKCIVKGREPKLGQRGGFGGHGGTGGLGGKAGLVLVKCGGLYLN